MKKRVSQEPDLSGFTEKEFLPMWTPNQVIRRRDTGYALLVVHVYRNCTIVVDLNNDAGLVTPKALLERDYHYYARDTDMKNEDEVNYTKDWNYHPINMNV